MVSFTPNRFRYNKLKIRTINKNSILFLFLILLSSLSTYGQTSWDCEFSHYSQEDGLSQNTIMHILQDKYGIMWFSTWDGINKFDGNSFTTYKTNYGGDITLANNRIDYMCEDQFGFLWLLSYDEKVHRFDPVKELSQPITSKKKNGDYINIKKIFALDNSHIWLQTSKNGAIRIITDSITHKMDKKHYCYENKNLYSDTVFHIYLDRSGKEWILTNKGIQYIYKEKVHKIYPSIQNKEKSTPFYSIHEAENKFFLGSSQGRLYVFENDTIYSQKLKLNSNIISIDSIANNKLIITTEQEGFVIYDLKTFDSKYYLLNEYQQFPNKPILSIYIDHFGEAWFEQEEPGVVVHYNYKKDKIIRETILVESTGGNQSLPSFSIHEDINHRLWVHPYNGGFSLYNREKNKLEPFYNDIKNPNWKFSNKIHSTFSDVQGNLWLCTHSKGLEKITFYKNHFTLFQPNTINKGLLSNEVRALCEDKDGFLWVGIKNGFLKVFDSSKKELGYLTEEGVISFTGTPLRGTVYNIMLDFKNNLWISTKGDGLVYAERTSIKNRYRLTRYEYDPKNPYSLSHNNIYHTHEDKNGNIWVATYGGGINYITENQFGQKIFINSKNRLKKYPIEKCHKVRMITSDTDGNIWVATTLGAITFPANFTEPEEIEFTHYTHNPLNKKSIAHNDIHWIHQAKNKEIYFATFGGGLNLLKTKKKEKHFERFNKKDGFSTNVLLAIVEDKNDNLWISTEYGLSKFSPNKKDIENYRDLSKQAIRFSEATSLTQNTENLLFGTNMGIISFNPDSLYKRDFNAPLIFTELQINNEKVLLNDKKSSLTQSINHTKELKLNYKQKTFSISYSALDFINPNNVKYTYILEGFDNKWINANHHRTATYTNVPKGKYIFKVRSTNSDGVWSNNIKELPITISPAPWETGWAYFAYFTLAITLIFITSYVLFVIYRLKHKVTIEKELSDLKLKFFTDVSHELRTPLTLVAVPIEQLLKSKEQMSDSIKEKLSLINKNTNRLLRLTNQILDFQKIQNKKMKLRVQQVHIVPFLQTIYTSFESLAINQDVNYDFIYPKTIEPLLLWIDKYKVENIMFNLISNAFKYTSKGGKIELQIEEYENNIIIKVKDTGIGISKESQKTIFNRFTSNLEGDNSKHYNTNTGIGLALVKSLVELHRATISLESVKGQGSCFSVCFKKGKNHYSSNEVDFLLKDITTTEKPSDLNRYMKNKYIPNININPKKTILIVEDNKELNLLLSEIFEENYNILTALNGKIGLTKAINSSPDLIISDIMMPIMDGIELLKKIRINIETSHIPFILLTAKNSIENKIKGLEYGADDYITKPFSSHYLNARVDNLIKRRTLLQQFYREKLSNNLSSLNQKPQKDKDFNQDLTNTDKEFVNRLKELMEENLDNTELVVEDLANNMAVSRTVFFNKTKSILGIPPVEFIKEFRLNYAIKLIKETDNNISQISYMVGMSDPRYFSKCFKEKTKKTPTQFRKEYRANRNVKDD